MIRPAFLGALAVLAGTVAASAGPTAVRLAARETLVLSYPGAIAVFAVDPSTVETSLANGQVELVGRRAGQTLVTVVLPKGLTTLSVQVDPPPPMVPTGITAGSGRGGSWEMRYDTFTRRLVGSLSAHFGEATRGAHLRLEAVRETGNAGTLTALPVASLEITTPDRIVVLGDQLVEESPLALDGGVLRGVHLQQDGLSAHVGVQADQPYNGLLVAGSGDRAVALSWRAEVADVTVIPGVLWLPDSGTSMPGVLSLGVESGKPGDPLHWRADLGWSDRLAGAFEIDWRTPERQAWLRGSWRPRDFAALRLARLAGGAVEGAWTERLGPDTTASASASAHRVELAAGTAVAASARLDLRHQLSPNWSVSASAGTGGYRGVAGEEVRRQTLAAGVAYEGTTFGASALLRHQRASGGDRGGNGVRLSARAAVDGWRGHAWVDAQQQAPTVQLLLQDRPDVARALGELGLTANDPEELLRLLRNNGGQLAARGVTLGRVQVDPLRVQAGVGVSWHAPHRGPEFGVRLLADDTPGLAGGRRDMLGTLYANWRVAGQTELGVAYTQVLARRSGGAQERLSSVQLSLRTLLDPQPLPGAGSRSIAGMVSREGEGGAALPAAGIEVVLDRSRRTVTGPDGRFEFTRPGPGGHRVEAVLPPQAGAYFTGPSVLTLEAGAQASFGITFAAAVLTGVLRNDAGQPIGGATVRLEGARPATSVTDSQGAYRFAAPEGEVRVAVDPDSLPPGYALGELQSQSQSQRLARGQPATADFQVRAERSLQGQVQGADGEGATVEALEAGRRVTADATGRFVLRGLPAGPATLVVHTRRGSNRQLVEVAPEPGILRGVQLRVP